MTSRTTSPLVLHGALGQRARLREGELLLRSRRELRRIPVAAIERVEVRGPRGRTLAVVLTGQEPVAARTHSLTSLRPAAVKRFAAVLCAALPVRDGAELSRSGSPPVTVEPLERRGRPAVQFGSVVAVAFCLVMAALLVTRSWGGAFCWVFVPMLVGAGVSLAEVGWKPVREGWILAVRGITVDGRRKNSGAIDAGDAGASYVYLFTDAEGVPRVYRGSNGGRDEEEIVYDPRNPGLNQLRRRNAAQFAAGLTFLLFLVLPLLGSGTALALAALADLFGLWSYAAL
ncbi:hypothetical protein ACF05T_29550 [Streptomyces lateritius]|uniref:DUF3592 domain-containing protein n=1 Tax=Streptomyces lateritius TaxID=67313 RepID=A0ABW6YK78_9ACTN